jgi:peroxiredoxin-like protein
MAESEQKIKKSKIMDMHYYNVDVTWKQDRRGLLSSPELLNSAKADDNSIEVATPPEFPKGEPGIWSPEHLFTAAVSSCLMTTFLSIAENSKLEFTHFECKSKGKLEQVDGKFIMSEIILEPFVTIVKEGDREKAERILKKAEAACLISNSIRSKVTMIPSIHVN